jgi:hypothetical protein
MKKELICLGFIAALSILLFSCNKERNETDSDFYISFKINGSQKTFKSKTQAAKVSVSQNNFYSIIFSAYEDSTSAEFFYLQVGQKGKKISTGTYTTPGQVSEDLIVLGGYTPASEDPSETYSAGIQLQEDNNPKLVVTITSLTDKTISGTFSGTFYNNDGDGPEASAFTEGKFSLPLH